MYQITFQVSIDGNSSVNKCFRFKKKKNKINCINTNYNSHLLVCQFLLKPLYTYFINFSQLHYVAVTTVIKKEVEAQKI